MQFAIIRNGRKKGKAQTNYRKNTIIAIGTKQPIRKEKVFNRFRDLFETTEQLKHRKQTKKSYQDTIW